TQTQTRIKSKQSLRILFEHEQRKTLLPLLGITFFSVLAYVAYNGTIPYYLTEQYGADSASVGNFVACINLMAVAVNFGLLPILKRYVKEYNALVGALVLSFIVMIGILLPSGLGIFFILGAMFVAGYTLMLAMTQTLISNQVTATDQGMILGLRQSFQASGQVVGSLAAGMLFSIHLYFPFFLTLIALGIAITISIQARKNVRSRS
ncbi:MAG: MFS transporter, partial [Culicoidibacterales bacterium]